MLTSISALTALVEQYRLEKIKTIGDAYMVVGGLIQTTGTTFALLNEEYDFEARSDVDVKGKGRVTTYLLRGRKTSKSTAG